MRLHLGCGDKLWDGYVNIDMKGGDVQCDIRHLPYDAELADEITAIHVAEHFLITEILTVFRAWKAILKPGGKLILELPCYDKVVAHIKADANDRMTRWALFGDPGSHQDGVSAVHKYCYTIDEMQRLLTFAGFSKVKMEVPLFHEPSRDMRWVATK